MENEEKKEECEEEGRKWRRKKEKMGKLEGRN